MKQLAVVFFQNIQRVRERRRHGRRMQNGADASATQLARPAFRQAINGQLDARFRHMKSRNFFTRLDNKFSPTGRPPNCIAALLLPAYKSRLTSHLHIMGQQYNKTEKRTRRKAYLKRKKEASKATRKPTKAKRPAAKKTEPAAAENAG